MGFVELNVLNNRPIERRALGIDLGTTNTLVAVWNDGRPIVLHPEGKSGIMPSVVNIREDGDPLVGRIARDQAVVDPTNTVFSIKRFMGRGLADVEADAQHSPYALSETEHGVVQVEIHGKKYTPQELSGLILQKVHQMACSVLGTDILEVVITVPAYFDDAQRQATRDAARFAGLDVLRIINEPTAASLAYGLDQKADGRIAVYDFGGGTFDVSLLSIEEGVFQVLATAGNTHLGGDDIDRVLIALMRTELADQLSAEELAEPGFQQAARLAAEKAKIALSHDPEHEINLVIPATGAHWHHTITRAAFNALIEPLIDRTLDACRQALSDAGLEPGDVDEVVLVGGSTRIPLVRSKVEQFFGRKPHTELNPDEVVALGAAAQAHVLIGGTRELLLMDVTPLSLGLETMGGAVAKLVERNSTIPCSVTEGFTTYVDNQTGIDFRILQGEREMADDNRTLARFKLKGIPPMPAGMAHVAVRFHLDADGVLTVTAKEESTGAKSTIDVQPMHGLTDGEVETMLEESITNAQEDFDRRRIVDLHAEIGSMIRAAEKNFEAARSELDPESLQDLSSALGAARSAQKSDTLADIQGTRDKLEQATLPLATLLMDSVVRNAVAGKRLDEL
ncbi:MAG: molecular chaperone DnaK [Gammaproteobacteria bacterium]|jgi:molecular chaperone DnaK